MITLYVGDEAVGTGADLDRLIPELAAANQPAEVRDGAGKLLGRFVPPDFRVGPRVGPLGEGLAAARAGAMYGDPE